MKDWEKMQGSQAERPDEFDTTSSPTTVYQRRNVQRVTVNNADGTKAELWEYEERTMSREEYADLLLEADPARRPLCKTRYGLTFDGRYFEVELYPFWKDRALLEAELRAADEEVRFPPELSILREVTGDEAYQTAALAALATPEAMHDRYGSATLAPLLFAAVGLTVGGLILGVKDEKGLSPVKSGRVEHKNFSGAKMLRIGLLIAAVCLLIAGVLNGSARDVFGKAVKICTECVGLG